MRPFLLVLLPVAVLGGCRGYLADHVRPEASIMAPELTRYGFSGTQAQCMSGKLTATLSVWQLRQFANVTRLIKDQARLTPGELVWLSTHVKDDAVPTQVRQAVADCGVNTAVSPAVIAARNVPAAAAPAGTSAAPPTGGIPANSPGAAPTLPGTGGIPANSADAAPSTVPSPGASSPPSASAPSATAVPATWLNLGSGVDKQSISIDASTLQGDKPLRRAWFRILAAGVTSSPNSYLLQIDCTGKTVNPLASRKHDPKGLVVEEVQHGANGAGANPIQGGSVIEIAYLSLCT
jgi:hypothetical protein